MANHPTFVLRSAEKARLCAPPAGEVQLGGHERKGLLSDHPHLWTLSPGTPIWLNL